MSKNYETVPQGSSRYFIARKQHKCDCCGNRIYKGDKYTKLFHFKEKKTTKSCEKCNFSAIRCYGD